MARVSTIRRLSERAVPRPAPSPTAGRDTGVAMSEENVEIVLSRRSMLWNRGRARPQGRRRHPQCRIPVRFGAVLRRGGGSRAFGAFEGFRSLTSFEVFRQVLEVITTSSPISASLGCFAWGTIHVRARRLSGLETWTSKLGGLVESPGREDRALGMTLGVDKTKPSKPPGCRSR